MITRPASLYFTQEAGIDLENDLKKTRKELAEKTYRPFLQSLRKQGMVGVRHGRTGNLPRLVPRHVVFIHQDPHQLRNGDGRMRVIQLENVLFSEMREVASVMVNPCSDHILKTGTGQEILLP